MGDQGCCGISALPSQGSRQPGGSTTRQRTRSIISLGNTGSSDRRENSIIPNISLQSAMAHLGSDPPALKRDWDTKALVLSSRNGAKLSHIKLLQPSGVSGPRAHQSQAVLEQMRSPEDWHFTPSQHSAYTSVSISNSQSPQSGHTRPQPQVARMFLGSFQVSLPWHAVPVLQKKPLPGPRFNPEDVIRAH